MADASKKSTNAFFFWVHVCLCSLVQFYFDTCNDCAKVSTFIISTSMSMLLHETSSLTVYYKRHIRLFLNVFIWSLDFIDQWPISLEWELLSSAKIVSVRHRSYQPIIKIYWFIYIFGKKNSRRYSVVEYTAWHPCLLKYLPVHLSFLFLSEIVINSHFSFCFWDKKLFETGRFIMRQSMSIVPHAYLTSKTRTSKSLLENI